ncbi:MAG: DNA-binding protein WhiA [Clostridium sp.]|nr:DNA-binding protein WhiA [Clostridium sp.]MCM1398391.1 DNA-binding protein WhiA [Clostridium sp.]MCM1458944.1 DNA-binding protein WhiA [Bacteroides sp.]
MSFSSQVKAELYQHISSSRHCRLAELGALVTMSAGKNEEKNGHGDNVKLGDKIKKLERLLELDANSEAGRQALKLKEQNKVLVADHMLIERSCCKQAFMRGAFLASGSVTDPNKGYHLEIVCENEPCAELVTYIMDGFDLDPKQVIRKKYKVVYIKDGSMIVDFLNIIGAHNALMSMENVRILKDMRNSVNRRVNCETANINKTVSAAVRQIEDIQFIEAARGLKFLPDNLRQIAELRLEEPELPLKELGEMLNPPIGKSGVNHRLRKISEIASGLRRK